MAKGPATFDTHEVDDDPSQLQHDGEVLTEPKWGEGAKALLEEFDYQVGRRRREIVRALIDGACKPNAKLLVAVLQTAKPKETEMMAKTVIQGVRIQIGSGSQVEFKSLPDPEEAALEEPREVRALEADRSPKQVDRAPYVGYQQ